MRLLAASLAFCLLSAQTQTTPDAFLAGIRQRMRETLTRLPNYTCRLTIERSIGPEKSRHLHPVDTVHLEVGYVDGKELYAWPGQKFGSAGLEQMLPAGGAAGSGDFALHLRSIFLTNAATFTYIGRNTRDGHDTLEFQYHVTRARSRYLLRTGPERQDVVGYHGEFRVDAKTLQLERLVIAIEEIPPKLHVSRAGTELTYALTRIGEADFLLPHSSELYIVNSDGTESRNMTRFDQCRQYLGESVVNFVEPSASVIDTPRPVTGIRLPGGLRIEITLQTAIERSRGAIGDPVRALVSRNVVRAGAIVVPKGAEVTGRITRLGERNTGRIVYQVVGIQLSSVEFANQRAEFRGTLESVAFAAVQVTVGAVQDLHGSSRSGDSPRSAEGILFIKGNSLHIPAGAHMVWRTADDISE